MAARNRVSIIRSQAERIRRAIPRGLIEYQGQTGTRDADLLASGDPRWWLTPIGELVYTSGRGIDRNARNIVDVGYPEREGFDGFPISTGLAESLVSRMDADGGWTRIRQFNPVKDASPPNCPTCGSFMSVAYPDDDFPFATCRNDGTTIGVDELIDQGVVIEVY